MFSRAGVGHFADNGNSVIGVTILEDEQGSCTRN